MSDREFYDLWQAALAAADRDAYVAEWGTSSIFSPDPDGPSPDYAAIADQLGNIWDVAHMSVADIAHTVGKTIADLAMHFGIAPRTALSWGSYRSCPDTHREWPNLIKIYRSYLDFVDHIKKGHYLDLDLLDLGTCRCEAVRGTFTEDEQITAYSVRAFLSSPIQISSTLENIDEFELSLYCNEEIIAINQDGAFHTAVPIYQDERDNSILDVFEKELEDGCFAYALFNMGETKQTVLGRFAALSPIRDVWAKEDLSPSNYLDLELMPHTVRILKCGEKLETVANAISVVEKQAEPTVADTDA